MPRDTTVYLVLKPSALTAARIVSAYDATAKTGWRIGLTATNYTGGYYDGTTARSLNSIPAATTAAHLLTWTLNQSAASKQELLVDNASQNADGAGQAANTTVPFGIGADLASTPANFYSGDILEIVVTTAGNSTDKGNMHTYGQTTWGTP
jgi:hypothetical protein